MARSSSTVTGRFDWRGALGRRLGIGSGVGRRRAGAAAAAPGAALAGGGRCAVRFAAGVESLEGRTLLSVTLVSANPATGAAVGSLDQFSVSDDGQYVAFVSTAPAADLGVAGATDGAASQDVFLKNLQTGAVTLVSGIGGTAVGGQMPSISSDGHFVAFTTTASGFASGAFTDTNGSSDDVYVFDSVANTYTLASAANGATAAVGSSIQPSISNNGRVVAFVSTTAAGSIVSGVTDSNANRDVFVRNLDTNQTALISADAGGANTGNAKAEEPAISGDGAFVAFMSAATDLTAIPDTGTANDVFRRAVAGTTTDLVSVASGTGGAAPAGGTGPSINNNGNLVAFASGDQSLAPGDPSASTIDVFVRDMTAGTTEVISVSATGAFANANATNPSLSDDGNFVVFQSSASNLTTGTNAAGSDVFLKNRADETVTRVSETDAGEPGTAGGGGVSSSFGVVNSNGTAVAFLSQATNFVPGTEDVASTSNDLFLWRTANVQPGDTTAPTATISAPNVTAEGGTQHQVTVVYADNAAVDAATIGPDDITVTGPGGGAPLAVTGATPTPSGNAASVSVVYTLSAPGGTWDAADNGTYTVTLPANAVRDTAANGVAAGSATFTVNTSGGGAGGPGADLVAAIAPKPALPAAVVGGSKGKLRLTVTNNGTDAVAATRAAPVSIQLRAVPTGSTTGAPVDITTIQRPLRIKAGRFRNVALPFVYPSVPDGTYNITATIDSTNVVTESDDTNNTATSAAPVTIALPFVDLVPTVGAPARGSLTIGRRGNVPITITNNGNVPASGTITVELFASGDNVIDAGDLPLETVTRKIKLKNGRARPVRISFDVPANLAAGQYFITTRVVSTTTVPETTTDNNTAVSSAAFQAT